MDCLGHIPEWVLGSIPPKRESDRRDLGLGRRSVEEVHTVVAQHENQESGTS